MKKILIIPLITLCLPLFALGAGCERLESDVDQLYSEYQEYDVELAELNAKYNAQSAAYLSTGTTGVGQGNADRLYADYVADYNQIAARQQQTAIEHDATMIEYNACLQQEAVNQYNDYLYDQQNAQLEAEQEAYSIQRESQIADAISNCDLEFFANEMTDEDRMDTWDERQACNKVETVAEQNIPVPNQPRNNGPVIPVVSTDTIAPLPNPPAGVQNIVEPEVSQETTKRDEEIRSEINIPEPTPNRPTSTDISTETKSDTEKQREPLLKRLWATVVSWFAR
jgi:hypothetical protein